MTRPAGNPANSVEDLDRVLWGAANIAAEANLFTEDGRPDERKAFYLLERGHLPATKVGRQWVTTPRRLRQLFAGESAA